MFCIYFYNSNYSMCDYYYPTFQILKPRLQNQENNSSHVEKPRFKPMTALDYAAPLCPS